MSEFEEALDELFEGLGESATRRINGNPETTEPQTALLSEPSVTRDRSRGDAQVYDLEIHLAAADGVTLEDVYEIDGELYRVSHIGRPCHGLKPIGLNQFRSRRTDPTKRR